MLEYARSMRMFVRFVIMLKKIAFNLALIAFLITIGTTLQARAQKDEKKEEATPIQKGQLTQQQKEHSKLFENMRPSREPLTDVPGNDVVISIGGDYGWDSSRPSLNETIQKLTCNSDAIIIGKMISKSSQLTTDSKFIFTDYVIRPVSVLKEDAGQPISERGDITISGPGGKVLLDGRMFTVNVNSIKRLSIGDEYLLFLNRISKTGAYTAGAGSALLSDGKRKLENLSDRPGELPRDAEGTLVIELIKSHVPIPCAAKP